MIKSLFHIPRCRRGYLKRFLLSLLKNPLAQDCHWRSYSGIDLGMKNSYFMFIAVTSPRRNISIKCCRVTQPPNNIIQQKPQDVGPPSLGGRGQQHSWGYIPDHSPHQSTGAAPMSLCDSGRRGLPLLLLVQMSNISREVTWKTLGNPRVWSDFQKTPCYLGKLWLRREAREHR